MVEDDPAPGDAAAPLPDVDMAVDGDSEAASASDAADEDDDDDDDGGDEDKGDDEAAKEDDAAADSSPEDLLIRAANHKEEGNAYFKAGDLELSARAYRKGTNLLKKLNKANSGDAQVKALLVALQTNLSTVCHRQGKHRMSRDVAGRALAIDPCCVKALYRRAVAHRGMGDFDAARADLRAALQEEPTNGSVKRELASVKKAMDERRKGEMARLQQAFSGRGSSLYSDKEEEERRRAREKAERKRAEEEAKERRKKEWEDECVARMAR